MKVSIFAVSFFLLSIFISTQFENTGRKLASLEVKRVDEIKTKIKNIYDGSKENSFSLSKLALENNFVEVEFSGKLNGEFIENDPNRPEGYIQNFIYNESGRVDVELAHENVHELVNKEINFKGVKSEGKNVGVLFHEGESVHSKILLEAEPIKDIVRTTEKMLVLLFKFDNSNRTFTNAAETQQHLRTGAFQGIFKAMTENRVHHDIDVHGWYHLNRLGDDDGGQSMTCRVSNTELKMAAADLGIDLTQYDNITMISNCTEYHTIGGRAILGKYDFLNIGKDMTWIRMASFPTLLAWGENPDVPGWTGMTSILVHERGHNFGLGHSNAIDCHDGPYLHPCENIFYGNKFDRMGGPDSSYTFNADQQRRAGWKSVQRDFLIINQPGVYQINRLTSKLRNKKIGAYINLYGTDKRAFMVEYRQAHMYDNRLSRWIFRNVDDGIHVYTNLSGSTETTSPKWNHNATMRILDSNPTELDWHQDTAYESLTGSYFDPISGVRISLQNIVGETARFTVEYDDDARICYKTDLDDWVDKTYVKLYTLIEDVYADPGPRSFSRNKSRSRKPTSSAQMQLGVPRYYKKDIKKKHIVLVPGDRFHFTTNTNLSDHLMCPRNDIKYIMRNDDRFDSWLISSGNTKPTTDGKGKDKPGGGVVSSGGPGGTPSFNGTKYFRNYDKNHELTELKVPESALGSNIPVYIDVEDRAENGEKRVDVVWLHIRSSHDAIIHVEAEEVRER